MLAKCDDKCRRFSDEELVSLLTNGAKPDWWKGENKICYNLVIKIFEMASGLSGNQGDMVEKSLLDHMISLPKHVKNLKRTACKYVEKNPADCCSIVSYLYQESKMTRCIGKECLKYDITQDLLDA